MASIVRDPGGRKRILCKRPDGKRVCIRLGKTTMRDAEAIKVKLEALVSAGISRHAVDDETARWLANLDSLLADKLARVGLIPKRETETLRGFIESYIESRTDVKPNTRRGWMQALTHLAAYFGGDRPVRTIGKGDAKDWRIYLLNAENKNGKPLAEATVRKYCGFAKHFFSEAVERDLIPKNPFAKLVSSPVGNRKREYFVTREETEKVLEACPDAEWRLIVALSRFGGLRCPSEHVRLRWEDVHWEQARLTVHSPKTERHDGHESRIVPLFPELLPYLGEAFEHAVPGSEYVISRYRSSAGNLRTQLARIVKRAGLKPWPRIFHNMRSTRQTELEDQHPSHVVCAWLGNSQVVARKHYLQVTDDHFASAVSEGGAKSGAANREMRRKAAQTRRTVASSAHEKPPVFQGDSRVCDALREASTGVDGNRTHRAPFQTPHWV